ncbi:MAG: LuxR C-terminal-related transcriptional regulator [Chloroflexota bacterium]
MSDLLLQTKLFKPALRPSLIKRTQLIGQLNAGLGIGTQGFDARLTLVSAPAGFGKTTLVSAWLAQLETFSPQFSGENTAWLSLDESDNDPVRFLVYLIAALQTAVPGIGQSTARTLQSPQPPAAEAILTLLINDIIQNDRPIILVLEEYHLITAPSVHQAVTFLLDHLPPLLQLVVTTRSDPPLPLSRLRASGELIEIRTDDLRFSTEETAVFLNQLRNLDLADEDVAALAKRTEGWIAGLHLAALSLRDREDKAGFITSFTGNSRYIMDYLVDEVLQQRPSGTKQFLLQTSILNPICAPLCNAVTGRQDGQANLERLEEANLFIIPLDDARIWYHYHPLFAEVLQARLQRGQRDRVAELHRRAAAWHASQGMVDEAVRYALAGGDFEEAANLIEGVAGNIVRRGSSASLIRWLDAMPEEVVRARPRLCLARGWTYLMGPAISLQSTEEWVQLAMRAAPDNGSIDSDLTAEAAAMQAMIAAIWGEVDRSIELSHQALDSLPSNSPWRSVMAFSLGSTLFLSGDIAAANEALGEALRLSRHDGAHYIQLNAASFLADIQVFQGHLSRALEMYQQVLAWADHGLPQKGALMAHGGLAHILCERNQLDAALAHIQLGVEQLEQVGGAWAALVLYRALARVRQAQGNWPDALEALNRAYQIGQNTQVSIGITLAAALRAHLKLAQGDLEAAEAWVATSGLSPEDLEASHPGLREEEYLTLARVLNAQGRQAEALSLLDRMLKQAEAEKRIGSVIIILILQGLIVQTQGHTARALTNLERALTLAEPEGYIRIFVDEGEPLRALLYDFRSLLVTQLSTMPRDRSHQLLAYTNRVLAAFQPPDILVTPRPETYFEPLSQREMEVLHLIAAGASNREIANALVVAVPTVKKHVSNIMSKLNATSRTQAVAEARHLGFL